MMWIRKIPRLRVTEFLAIFFLFFLGGVCHTFAAFEVAWQSLVPEQDEERLAVAFFAWQRDRMQEVLLSGRYCVPRAVIWRSYAGIGNRVMQLASLVHFAALTSRPILVDWQVNGDPHCVCVYVCVLCPFLAPACV